MLTILSLWRVAQSGGGGGGRGERDRKGEPDRQTEIHTHTHRRGRHRETRIEAEREREQAVGLLIRGTLAQSRSRTQGASLKLSAGGSGGKVRLFQSLWFWERSGGSSSLFCRRYV